MDPLIKGPAEDSISEGEQETELVSDKVDEADEHDEAYEANKTDNDDEADEDVAAVSVSPNILPGPSTVADKIDKPNIWTDKMWREKQQLYPWLAYCVKMENLGVISVRLLKVLVRTERGGFT